MRDITSRRFYAPVVTPFKENLEIDYPLFIEHCKWIIGQGGGLAIFGTNSEANSISLEERSKALRMLLDAGVNPNKIIVGSGTCSLPETVKLTREAVELHCEGVLVLPPFFYKNISDDGLIAYFSKVIDSVGSDQLKLYLYHIPQFTDVPLSVEMIESLLEAYPNIIAGIKDSSGDWTNTKLFLERFPELDIFPSSEALLEKALPLGAAGCISATANVQPGSINRAIDEYGFADYQEYQAAISEVRRVVQGHPMIAALKYIVAQRTSASTWSTVRPPLEPLSNSSKQQIMQELSSIGFC